MRCHLPAKAAIFLTAFMFVVSNVLSQEWFGWDAAQDGGGDSTWSSTTTNLYDWTFDSGNQTPVAVADTRFAALTKAYVFPAAADRNNATWDTFGSWQPASFEFVVDVDSDNGLIFEAGGSGDGIAFYVTNGILKGTIAEATNVTVSYTLTPEDMARFMHVVFVADGTADTFKLYVDGQLRDTATWSRGADWPDWAGADTTGLGGSSSSTPTGIVTSDFSGKIAIFRFYRDTALNVSQIGNNFAVLSRPPYLSLDFEDAVLGNLPPDGWDVIGSTYTTTNGLGNPGQCGVLDLNSGTNVYLVNGGDPLDASKPINGSFDFYLVEDINWSHARFYIGNIQEGLIGTSLGAFLQVVLLRKTVEGRAGIRGGDGTLLFDGSNNNLYEIFGQQWYTASFTWTPTNELTGTFSFEWEGTEGPKGPMTVNDYTFDSQEIFFGFGTIANPARFDNIQIWGSPILPAGTVLIVR